MPIKLRQVELEDLSALNTLILASKKSHGYDDTFMAACASELRLTDRTLKQDRTILAEDEIGIVGIAQLSIQNGSCALEKMFVDPKHFGGGIGRMLFQWAVDTARDLGKTDMLKTDMLIESDPDAVGFYEALGATRIGDAPSGSIQGRQLPLLRKLIPPATAAQP